MGWPSSALRVVLIVSQRQLARPAVVLSVFVQTSLTPPVDSASLAILPCVISRSSSARKLSASACFLDSKDFLVSFLGSFFGLALLGLLVTGGRMSLRGECWSFQSLTKSWFQKASILGRWGVLGICIFL